MLVLNQIDKTSSGYNFSISILAQLLVAKCQAFMLQYKDIQQSKRTVPRRNNTSKHKKYDRLQDKIQYLKYESDWIDLFNQFTAQPIPPKDGRLTLNQIQYVNYPCTL